MYRSFILAVIVFFTLAGSASAESAERTELWTGSRFFYFYRFGMCFSSEGDVRGVMHVRTHIKYVGTYRFKGTVKDGKIIADRVKDQTTDKLKARLLSDDKVEGVITFNGKELFFEAVREHDAQLTSECAPLPEENRSLLPF